MNLDLRDYTTFPADVELTEEADNADYGVDGVVFVDIMTLRASLQRVGEEYLCSGTVRVMTEQECSRCLNPFENMLEGDLNFIIKTERAKSVMAKEKGVDVAVINPGRPIVELNEMIRQSLSLEVPMKPLCSDECLGICPSCGINRNEGSCDCKEDETDDRWDGLKDL